VTDQADPCRLHVEACIRLLGGKDVLPDRIAGRGVEEGDFLAFARRLQLAQHLQRSLGDVLTGPGDRSCGGLGERSDIQGTEHREVMVADQAERAALPHQIGALVGLGTVAEHVAQAPDLLDAGIVDRIEGGLERWQICVDVADDGGAHWAASVPGRGLGPYDGAVSATDSIAELRAAVQQAALALRDGEPTGPEPTLDRPPKPELGDYSSNAAMLLAAPLGEAPRDVATRLGIELERELDAEGSVDRVEVAGPGFVNLFLSDDWYRRAMARLAAAGGSLGPAPTESPQRILVEYVSANPTGPLHVGGGRHAAYGDALVRLLRAVGHQVQSEYYVNDAGGQVQRFAASIVAAMTGGAPPEEGYEGAYVAELAKQLQSEGVDPADGEAVGRRGIELILAGVRATLERFGVGFDSWFSERDLYANGEVEAALTELERRGHTYKSEGALWLRSTDFGDDKDRVLVRAEGDPTYLAADVAYHRDKLERGFEHLINVLGADHHGYAPRLRAAIAALGTDPETVEALIMRLVHIVESGERAQMSKRSGDFVSLDELVDDIGVDATRWFMLWRSHDTTVDLDLELARRESSDNPVYYVQYAHARIASILRKAGGEAGEAGVPTPGTPLEPAERDLVKRLLEFPEEVREAAQRRAPHRICAYSTAVAADFHAFYRDCQVVGAEGEGVERSRLGLCLLAQRTIAASLDLLGISAPEKM
jgi:arginyl-tRNA synthetase